MTSRIGTHRVAVRVGADVAHYPPATTFGPRRLRDYEFVWLLSGAAQWEAEDHAGVELRPGLLLLARPGMTDRFDWAVDRASVHGYVHFRLLDRGGLGAPDRWPVVRDAAAGSPLHSLCHYLLWLGSTPSVGAVGRTNDVLQWMLDLFVRGPLPEHDEPGLPDHLVRLAGMVRRTWRAGRTTALSVAELSTGAGVSAGHLSRVFRARFGVGPVAALELVRLARAATLLQRSNLSVAAVADACGFANPYHFSRRFHQAYGLPPREFRSRGPEDDPLGPVTRAHLLPLAYALLFEDDDGSVGAKPQRLG